MTTTSIEWVRGADGADGKSWNPIRARDPITGRTGWYCEPATRGCELCYAERFNGWVGTRIKYQRQNRNRVDLYLDEKALGAPRRWKKPHRVFVCSMTDLFAEFVPDAWLDRIFGEIGRGPRHTFMVLTKRAARLRDYLRARPPSPNVWAGVSVEDQRRAVERIPLLVEVPATVRWVSAEPLLSALDLTRWLGAGIDWVVAGAESGAGARPCQLDWVRGLRDQCAGAGIAFFWKQHAEHGKKIPTPILDGRHWVQYPAQPPFAGAPL